MCFIVDSLHHTNPPGRYSAEVDEFCYIVNTAILSVAEDSGIRTSARIFHQPSLVLDLPTGHLNFILDTLYPSYGYGV